MKQINDQGLSQAIEDYLKAIYLLLDKQEANTGEIAALLEVSPSSVTKMLRKLSLIGLINYQSYKNVELTDAGRKAALRVIRKHRLIESFLHGHLGYDWDEVHNEACILEHYISDKLEDKIDKLMGYPETDPHGDPIPDKFGNIPETNSIPLTDIDVNVRVRIGMINNENPDLLKYLSKLGLIPGAELMVVDKQPFGGSYIVKKGEDEMLMGVDAVKHIYVHIS